MLSKVKFKMESELSMAKRKGVNKMCDKVVWAQKVAERDAKFQLN